MSHALTSAPETAADARRVSAYSLLTVALLVLVNGLIAGGAWWFRARRTVIPETPLQYSAIVPESIMHALRAHAGDRWDYLALLFAEPTAEKLRYVNVLSGRHAGGRIKFAYVADDGASHLEKASHLASSSLAVVPDAGLAIHAALHVPTSHTHGGLVVLDRRGQVAFWRLPQPGADDLRQLVEKFAGVPIDYEVKATGLLSRFAVGQPLPPLNVIGVDGQPRGALTSVRKTTVVVFAGGCKTCELSRRVWQLQTLRDLVRADPERSFLIVTPGGDPAWMEPLDAFQRRAGIPAAEIVLTNGEVERDPYWTRYGTREEAPIVIETGDRGEVATIRTLEDATTVTEAPQVSAPAAPSLPAPSSTVPTITPVFGDVHRPARIKTDAEGRYYILAARDHSILVYGRDKAFIRRIGAIGQGPGELFHPKDFAIAPDGTVWVADTQGDRVQAFDAQGRGDVRMRLDGPSAITVLPGGDIVVVTDWDDALMRVYSPKGELLRTVTADAAVPARDPRLRAFFNRGRVIADAQSSVYYMFLGATPARVRQFPAAGAFTDLLVDGAALASRVLETQARRRDAEAAGDMSIHNTLNAVAVEPATGHLWVAPAAPEVYVYAKDGTKVATYDMRDASGRAHGGQDLWFSSSGEGLFISGGRVYSFAAPPGGRAEPSAGS